MSQYTKYKLYKLQQRASGSSDPWVDVVPTTYSYNGNGTQTPVVVESASTDCGYTPPVEPMYKWVTISINQDYVCDDCLKFELKYSDNTTYGLECSSSTTLTMAEIRGGSSSYSAITSADIGSCVTIIGQFAFQNCSSLSSVTIPNNITSMSSYSFSNCSSLEKINIPDSVTSIGSFAFQNCSGLTSCTIGNGLTSIGSFAFARCSSLTSLAIGSGVTSIGSGAFDYCRSLTSVTIPNSVTSIGLSAFLDCTSLTSITVNAVTPPTLGNSVFSNTNNCPIYVPSGSVDAYKAASGWSSYASRIQAIPNS